MTYSSEVRPPTQHTNIPLPNKENLETKFHVKPLPRARIPIIKLSLDSSPGLPLGIACDIGFENRLALENTRLLMCYAMVDPDRVRTMVLFCLYKFLTCNFAYSNHVRFQWKFGVSEGVFAMWTSLYPLVHNPPTHRKINSPYTGTLSSYGYVLLVIYFLVHVKNPPVLPNLQQIPPLRPMPPVSRLLLDACPLAYCGCWSPRVHRRSTI